MKSMPNTAANVITIATTIPIINALVSANPPSCQSPASFIAPIMISFHIRAMIKPKAPAIATAIVLFTSF